MYCRMQHSHRPSREIGTYDHLQSTADRIKSNSYNQKHASIKQLLRALLIPVHGLTACLLIVDSLEEHCCAMCAFSLLRKAIMLEIEIQIWQTACGLYMSLLPAYMSLESTLYMSPLLSFPELRALMHFHL
jgi:hypothetical protein